MDHQGHPQQPLRREALPLEALVRDFLVNTREEDELLAGRLAGLDDSGRRELGGILGRFDLKGQGALDGRGRLLARRVLTRIQRPTRECLVLTNQILDYLDLNANAVMEDDELDFTIEIFEWFARVDSDNHTLNELELRMLQAVLRHLDTNDNRKLDAHEKRRLHDGLANPQAFLDRQRLENPLLQEVLSRR